VTVDERFCSRCDVPLNSYRAQHPSHPAAGSTAFEKAFQVANEIDVQLQTAHDSVKFTDVS
jgi:hypothetical protein